MGVGRTCQQKSRASEGKVVLIPIVAPAVETGVFLQAARVETMRLQCAVVSSIAPTPPPISADCSLILSSNTLNLVHFELKQTKTKCLSLVLSFAVDMYSHKIWNQKTLAV